ncbi:MAG: DUF58 domain-containing protein [Actinobacteria bacterium]|nr:DUF58 domain-containing protein [Actinomycetota bacterium]
MTSRDDATRSAGRGGMLGFLDAVQRKRTPAEPGPGTITPETLRALDLAIGRRVAGILAGDYRSAFAGLGTELHQVRPYQPGDDVRRIDWNVTARTGQVHVRVELAERALVTWLVLDASASMGFGTADRRKADVAEGVAIAVGYAATRRGNRLGVVSFGPSEPFYRKPRSGRQGLLLALAAINQQPAGNGSLRDALQLTGGVALQRSLIVVISDFRGPMDWQPALLQVAARHPTLAVEIRDPREQVLADVGELRLTDPETGEQLLIDTEDPAVREQFAANAEADRRHLAHMLTSVGVPHIALSTDGDWLQPLTVFLNRSDRR